MGQYLDGSPAGGVYNSFNPSLYQYGAQNPLRYKDPDGNSLTDVFTELLPAAGKSFGALAAYGVGVATGDQALVDVALEGMREMQSENVMAIVSTVNPVPGTSAAVKTAKMADKAADAAGAVKKGYSSLTDKQFVQEIAKRSERKVGGAGAAAGIRKHSYAEKLMNRYQRMTGQRQNLETEQSYLGGVQVPRGTKGSARPDVYDPASGDVYDYKFTTNPGRGIPAGQQGRNQANLPNVTKQSEINP